VITVTQVPKSTFWVNADNTTVHQIGTSTGPFRTLGAAIAAAVAAGPPANCIIRMDAGDYSTEDVTLPQNVNWLIEGPVSGFTLLGNVTWQSTGGGTPVPQSSLFMRNVGPKSITCADGPGGPATRALFFTENVAVAGNVTATGTGTINALFTGLSTACSEIAGSNVSAVVSGVINMPHSAVGLTNVQSTGSVTASGLWSRGSQVNGSITTTDAAELITSQCTGLVTASTLTVDEYTYARGVSHDGTPITVRSAAPIWLKFTLPFTAFAAGITTKTLMSLLPRQMIHGLIVKTSAPWVGITMKVSVGITGTVNKYVNNYACTAATSDANFAQPNPAAVAPLSWVNPTPILLTATAGAGIATAGSVDVWVQVSTLP